MTVYDKIKKLCDERDLTIMEVEQRAEVGNGLIGKWRESTPNMTTLVKVAKVLGVTVDELIAES